MESNDKTKVIAREIQRAKRQINDIRAGHGHVARRITQNELVQCTVSLRELEVLRRRHYRVRVIQSFPVIRETQDSVRETEIIFLIELTRKVLRALLDMRNRSRLAARSVSSGGGGGGENKPPQRIFHPFIDEAKMADCILSIKDGYFHEQKECTISHKEHCSIYDFFILAHFYFCYIGILDKTVSKLAYCNYLNHYVFADNNIVNVRSYNNYDNLPTYKSFAELLDKMDNIRFDYRLELPRPAEEIFLMAPFQDVGWRFHFSPYFDTLRVEQIKVQNFKLQGVTYK